ncbi:hypothetical protein C8Q70DRAFT_1005728 [Cubamyces menziesii]|nr:hypothetical protein C8Q70DRAFT_1005728 [Cubamyces menziesii]
MHGDAAFSLSSSIKGPHPLARSRADGSDGDAVGEYFNEEYSDPEAYPMLGQNASSADDLAKSYSESLSLHNAALPVNSLPTEILMVIFYHARRILLDIRFTHVCRRWREVICAMPEFWTSTLRVLPPRRLSPYAQHSEGSSDGCDPLLERCLTLSAPRIIHARLNQVRDIELRSYAPHIDRIAEMTVDYNNIRESTPVLMKLLRQGMPNLTTLHYFPTHRPWILLDTWPAITDAFFPNLRRLDTATSLLTKLSPSLMQSLQHLTLRGYLASHNTHDLAVELGRCPSLVSLTFQSAVPDSWLLTRDAEAHSGFIQLRHLRRLSIEDYAIRIRSILHRAALSPTVHLTLDIRVSEKSSFMSVFSDSTSLHSHILPSISRLYLGCVQAKGHVRILGFIQNGQEQLNVARWHDFAAVLAHIMEPFAGSGATALAIHLPHLPITLERASWDQDGSVPCPMHLRQLELLGGTPLKLKQRFTRWFLRSCGCDGRPTSDESTLCWVFNVERGREQHSREDLWGLEAVLAEHPGQKLGVLELYGTTLSGQIFTNVSRVPTNPARCAEVVEAHMARLSSLVSQVVIV